MEQQTIPVIAPGDVLQGHSNIETAHLIDDYPYGFTLRCKRRVWVEQTDKGTYKGQYRFVSQTTNPKVEGEVWNRPKASTYYALVVLYRDQADEGHVKAIQLHVSGSPAEFLALLRVRHVLSPDLQKRFETMLAAAQRAEYRWKPWMEALNAILVEQSAESGSETAKV